jgi:hypothetical protein
VFQGHQAIQKAIGFGCGQGGGVVGMACFRRSMYTGVDGGKLGGSWLVAGVLFLSNSIKETWYNERVWILTGRNRCLCCRLGCGGGC